MLKDEKYHALLQYFASFTVSITAIGFVCGYSWPSPALPYLTGKSSDIPISKDQGAWIASLYPLGLIIGYLLNPLFVDRIGRKRTLLMFSLPQVASWFLITIAKNYQNLYIARVIGGIGYGGGLSCSTVYVSEIGNVKNRGVFLVLLKCMMNLGFLFTMILGAFINYQNMNLVLLTMPVLFVSIFVFMPDSSYFLDINSRRREKEEEREKEAKVTLLRQEESSGDKNKIDDKPEVPNETENPRKEDFGSSNDFCIRGDFGPAKKIAENIPEDENGKIDGTSNNFSTTNNDGPTNKAGTSNPFDNRNDSSVGKNFSTGNDLATSNDYSTSDKIAENSILTKDNCRDDNFGASNNFSKVDNSGTSNNFSASTNSDTSNKLNASEKISTSNFGTSNDYGINVNVGTSNNINTSNDFGTRNEFGTNTNVDTSNEFHISNRFGTYNIGNNMVTSNNVGTNNDFGSKSNIGTRNDFDTRSQISEIILFDKIYYTSNEKVATAEETENFLNSKISKEFESAPKKLNFLKDNILWRLFSTQNHRRGLEITLVMGLTNILSGHAGITTFTQQIFTYEGAFLAPEKAAVVLATVTFVLALLSTQIVERIRRKVLLAWTGVIASISLVLVGIFFFCKEEEIYVGFIEWVPLFGITIYDVMLSCGMGNVFYVYQGELFANEVKSEAIAFNKISYMGLSFLFLLQFQNFIDIVGTYLSFFCFMLGTLFGTFWVYILTPETKGVKLDDIQVMLKKKKWFF